MTQRLVLSIEPGLSRQGSSPLLPHVLYALLRRFRCAASSDHFRTLLVLQLLPVLSCLFRLDFLRQTVFIFLYFKQLSQLLVYFSILMLGAELLRRHHYPW